METNKKIYHREYMRKWRLTHPDDSYKKWKLANPEKAKEYKKAWQLAHPESYRKWRKKYRLLHHEKAKETSRKWHIEHPEKERLSGRKHHAKRRQLHFFPINKPFKGSEGHHINTRQVIYIPKKIHRSIWHSVLNDVNMDEINKKAFDFLMEEGK